MKTKKLSLICIKLTLPKYLKHISEFGTVPAVNEGGKEMTFLREEVFRTDDGRFDSLPDWPYAPCYVDDLQGYEGLRGHYIDEGPTSAKHTYLCLHGHPCWSYTYRKMIPVFLAAGGRVVAPDFYGCGRSDKPSDNRWYSWDRHRNFLLRFIERLDLRNITLVCQDWGGMLGLTLPMDMPDRFDRIIAMNTTLAVGLRPNESFKAWRQFVLKRPDYEAGAVVKGNTPHLTDEEVAAYNAPFPDARYMAGMRRFVPMVMTNPDMEGVHTSKEALEFLNKEWTGKSFLAVGHQAPMLGQSSMTWLARKIRGCPPPLELHMAGHFVQEWGKEVAEAALVYFEERAAA